MSPALWNTKDRWNSTSLEQGPTPPESPLSYRTVCAVPTWGQIWAIYLICITSEDRARSPRSSWVEGGKLYSSLWPKYLHSPNSFIDSRLFGDKANPETVYTMADATITSLPGGAGAAHLWGRRLLPSSIHSVHPSCPAVARFASPAPVPPLGYTELAAWTVRPEVPHSKAAPQYCCS